jgi:hypothetical protein
VHKVRYFDGKTTHLLEGVDKLTIGPVGRGWAQFSVDTIADNGHTCRIDGVALQAGDHFEFRASLDLDPGLTGGQSLQCLLELRVKGQKIELRDDDNHCKLYFCGMKAGLDGLLFRKTAAGKVGGD